MSNSRPESLAQEPSRPVRLESPIGLDFVVVGIELLSLGDHAIDVPIKLVVGSLLTFAGGNAGGNAVLRDAVLVAELLEQLLGDGLRDHDFLEESETYTL